MITETGTVRPEGAAILPADDTAPPNMWHRLLVFPLLFVPWLVMYEWVVYRGPAPGALRSYLPGEVQWPIWQWMEVLYFSPYVLVALAPLCAPTNRVLRRFIVAGGIATVLVFLMFLTLPVIAPPRPFQPSGILGQMMLYERAMDLNNGTAAFPSFHVVWAFLGAAVFAARWPRARFASWLWAALVAASCVLTGMHSLLDIVAGFAVFLLVYSCSLFLPSIAIEPRLAYAHLIATED
jgi:membrane-associated phospholipid phosphatase